MKRATLSVSFLIALFVSGSIAEAQVGGSGTPGKVPVWVDSATLGDSVLTQDPSGNIGLGTATPAVKLDVLGGDIRNNGGLLIGNNTDLSRTTRWTFAQINHKPTDTYGGTFYSLLDAIGTANFSTSQPRISFSSVVGIGATDPGYTGDLAQLFGAAGAAHHDGSGSIPDVAGLYGEGFNRGSGTADRLMGGWFVYNNQNAAFTSNAYGVFVSRPSRVGSNDNIANAYGVLIEDQDRGTNRWQLYSEGTQPSYFAAMSASARPARQLHSTSSAISSPRAASLH
jgi:hypothetical protein